MIIDGMGENSSKIIEINYCEMCQIHKTVINNPLLGICMAVPLVPPSLGSGVMKCCSDPLPPSTCAGVQDDVSFTNSLKLYL